VGAGDDERKGAGAQAGEAVAAQAVAEGDRLVLGLVGLVDHRLQRGAQFIGIAMEAAAEELEIDDAAGARRALADLAEQHFANSRLIGGIISGLQQALRREMPALLRAVTLHAPLSTLHGRSLPPAGIASRHFVGYTGGNEPRSRGHETRAAQLQLPLCGRAVGLGAHRERADDGGAFPAQGGRPQPRRGLPVRSPPPREPGVRVRHHPAARRALGLYTQRARTRNPEQLQDLVPPPTCWALSVRIVDRLAQTSEAVEAMLEAAAATAETLPVCERYEIGAREHAEPGADSCSPWWRAWAWWGSVLRHRGPLVVLEDPAEAAAALASVRTVHLKDYRLAAHDGFTLIGCPLGEA
jgi:hypothetical protein